MQSRNNAHRSINRNKKGPLTATLILAYLKVKTSAYAYAAALQPERLPLLEQLPKALQHLANNCQGQIRQTIRSFSTSFSISVLTTDSAYTNNSTINGR